MRRGRFCPVPGRRGRAARCCRFRRTAPRTGRAFCGHRTPPAVMRKASSAPAFCAPTTRTTSPGSCGTIIRMSPATERAITRNSRLRRSPTDTCTCRLSPTVSSSTDCGNGPAVNVLDERAVQERLHYPDLIPAIAEALAALSAGKVVQPVRTVLPVAPHHGFFAVMPAYADGGALGAKLVTFYPQNVGVHTHHAVIVMLKAETGEPLAMMDGRLITEMRTAVATAADAVRGADVVVVAASSTTPILQGRWLSPGTHVNAIGATRPDWRELDDDLVTTARIFVDSREAALRESGDVIAARNEVTEIGAVLAGVDPGRRNAEELTLFKSVGVAVEDVAAAALVLRA